MRIAADLPAGLCPSGPHHAVPAPAAGHREQLKASNRPAPLLNVSAWKSMGRPMNCGRPLGCWLICMPGILVLGSSIEADHVLGEAAIFGNFPRCLCPVDTWHILRKLSAVRIADGSSVSPTGSVRHTSGGRWLPPSILTFPHGVPIGEMCSICLSLLPSHEFSLRLVRLAQGAVVAPEQRR